MRRLLLALVFISVAQNAPSSEGDFSFDIDGDGETEALTDGLLVLRYFFGFSGMTLSEGAVSSSAVRADAGDIEAYLSANVAELDVDGDGEMDALTDGLLLLRYLFGFRDETLITGALSSSAVRTTSSEIEAYTAERIVETASDLQTGVGHMNHESPHAGPITLLPDDSLVYVVNTPADTVDVIDTGTGNVIQRINVGIDPVGIAVRPDGLEVWVTNHVSDSVSVIDADPDSATRHHVLETIQAFDNTTKSTRFDEPVGIAFANNGKAYVALSRSNQVAVINVTSRTITSRLDITAQEPRALTVRGDRLYVIPFESNNQTQVSGCFAENIDGELCTYDHQVHVVEAPDGGSTSAGYVSDIVRHPGIPDRDLYVFDTNTDQLMEIVDGLGTLLYGITVDGNGNVFVAQTEGRNDANGKAGTQGHGLAELENRTYLNQITHVDCGSACNTPGFIDLEPLPPVHPEPGMGLATPFAIAVSGDNNTLVATAAGSNTVFTVDADTGNVLGRVTVESNPRGLALELTDEGAPARAWVLNALANSVSLVDLADPADPSVVMTTPLEDPTEPDLKLGRMAFYDANASSTGTFSCASCHPDGHNDQLIWILDTPICDQGCDQIQPRLVQDIRGLRDTAPYHWDGIPGDPFGGVNTASLTWLPPNCDKDVPESCTLQLIDGSLETTMCDQTDCGNNDEGKPGELSGDERAAMARYLLSVPYPNAPERPYTNTLSNSAMSGFDKFHFTKQCGNCHRAPFLTTTNMGGSGMDVPTWRGGYDRWKNAPQNRFFIADLVGNDTRGFPERFAFTSDLDMFQLILETSVGFSGSLARQVTLNTTTTDQSLTTDLLDALERSAHEGGIVLQGEGRLLAGAGADVAVQFKDDAYVDRSDSGTTYTRQELFDLARAGDLLMTITARLGVNTDYANPQPTLRPDELPILPMFPGGRPADLPELFNNEPMRLRGEHIHEGAYIIVDGRRVEGTLECESGTLPDCYDDLIIVQLDEMPATSGMHMLQVHNPEGLFSNDLVFLVPDSPAVATSANLISSGGAFNGLGSWTTVLNDASVTWDGEADFTISDAIPEQRWRVQLRHQVNITAGVQYTLCYSARADDIRYLQVDLNTDDGERLMGTGVDPEVGSAVQGSGASLIPEYHNFRHRFISPKSDPDADLFFTLGQSDIDVQIDDVGLYRGTGCGTP